MAGRMLREGITEIQFKPAALLLPSNSRGRKNSIGCDGRFKVAARGQDRPCIVFLSLFYGFKRNKENLFTDS
jgi:hypothetical protein